MNTQFFFWLLLGIFAVGITMTIHNSQAEGVEGDADATGNCLGGNSQSTSAAGAWGEISVTFLGGGYQVGDHVSGIGDITLGCGDGDPRTYANLSVSCVAVKRPLWQQPWAPEIRIIRVK